MPRHPYIAARMQNSRLPYLELRSSSSERNANAVAAYDCWYTCEGAREPEDGTGSLLILRSRPSFILSAVTERPFKLRSAFCRDEILVDTDCGKETWGCVAQVKCARVAVRIRY